MLSGNSDSFEYRIILRECRASTGPCRGIVTTRFHARLAQQVMLLLAMVFFGVFAVGDVHAEETLEQFQIRLAAEARQAYDACPFAPLSKDFLSRYSRDEQAKPAAGEVLIDNSWKILVAAEASPLCKRMAGHLREFLAGPMKTEVPVKELPTAELVAAPGNVIVFFETGGGDDKITGSFTIDIQPGRVTISGRDAPGLRDGVVKLVELVGFRQAPILTVGNQVYRPRLVVRTGSVPVGGTLRETVFLGNNAVLLGGSDLCALSTSKALPELAGHRKPAILADLASRVKEAKIYQLQCFLQVGMAKFPKDDPVFEKHPEIRGALTWKASGDYVLCTEDPLVRKFLRESMAGIFRDCPGLDGVVIIIGGESFYHCFMRPYNAQKRHTNCARCEKIGADAVVANLCNTLAEAAREVNPNAEIIAWPYSAADVWSADPNQDTFIAKLKPGTAILTEVEKDEQVKKPEGITKRLWDYSIDMVGLGNRAQAQLTASTRVGIPIYFKTELERTYEAPGLPQIPCLDRWLQRSEAVASSGAKGVFSYPAFGPFYGTSAAEIAKAAYWEPAPKPEDVLQSLATRIAGNAEAGKHLCNAWAHVSRAIEYSPELPPYYMGPYYLGPAQPMCADRTAKLPEIFYGRMLFASESTKAEGMVLRPTFWSKPTGGDKVAAFGRLYRQMEKELRVAVEEVGISRDLVPSRCRMTFQAEEYPIRWFYHIARTEANFYESCQLRDQILANKEMPSEERQKMLDRWMVVLKDERDNTTAALPIMEADSRLDFYFGGDRAFAHGADMIRAKAKLIDQEIAEYLPSLGR